MIGRSRTWRALVVALGVVIGLLGAFAVGRATAPSSGERSSAEPSAVDVGFCQDMGMHHEQAVLMSNLAGTRAGPGVKAIADAILTGQSQELGVVRGWLQLWGKPAESSTPMSWMSDTHAGMGHPEQSAMPTVPPEGGMPGMASPEELTDLWAKSGQDFDVLFLRLMIRHHQGGVAMARYASTHARVEVVRQAAEAMLFQQAEDIGQLQALLTSYGATPLPPP